MCQYVSREREIVLSELGPGQYFGDLPMLFRDYHLASVRAKTNVEVTAHTARPCRAFLINRHLIEQYCVARTLL